MDKEKETNALVALLEGNGEEVFVELENGNKYTVAFSGGWTQVRPHYDGYVFHKEGSDQHAEMDRVTELAKQMIESKKPQ